MESSVRKKLSVAYADFCSTQKTVAANLAKTQGAAFKDDIVSIDKYEKMYQDFEDGNPFVKLMTKQATVNNFIKILKGVDTTQDGLVYLTILITSFYSRYLFSVNALKGKMENGMNLEKEDLTLIGFTKSNLSKISDLSKYTIMDVVDFNKLTFDSKQLAYLKACAVKVLKLGGGVFE